MNKLREQIAELLNKSECDCSICMHRHFKVADAILALLQPRLLTKDEAAEIYGLVPVQFRGGGCGCPLHEGIAKLKLIQEDDSE